MEIIIDLENLQKSGLHTEEYIVLQAINEGIDIDKLPFINKDIILEVLDHNLWIKRTEDGFELRGKARELFEPKMTLINFDEFWEVFPVTTPSGRVLRAANKESRGKLTRDYDVCRKKYLAKVKNKDLHAEIIEIVKARVFSKDYEYINNIETYINKQKWQQDIKYLSFKPLVGRTNEMV
jgi:hypothetical protein